MSVNTTPVWGWGEAQKALTPQDMDAVVRAAVDGLAGLPLAVLRNRGELGKRAQDAVQRELGRLGYVNVDPRTVAALVNRVVARVGGLGFLDALLPPNNDRYTDIQVNADGTVWAREKGAMAHVLLEEVRPEPEEIWRVVEVLLAAEGKALSEATPTVDAKIPRDPNINFGGARVKVIHPILAPGVGARDAEGRYRPVPVISIRLYEPRPVPPEQIVRWGVFPEGVMEGLLDAVRRRLRVLVIGGTSTGKTTLLAALSHGIPEDARIVKIEDPEEIWLPHPNVVTLEARPAPPGSTVPPYDVADGVDDALRLAPSHIIVGEVRKGEAALSLFRAFMTDHAGLTTFHAEGPDEAVFRLAVLMYATKTQVRFEAAKALFEQAIDLVVQVGWRDGKRKGLGVWEVTGLSGGNVKFRRLWEPGAEQMETPSRTR